MTWPDLQPVASDGATAGIGILVHTVKQQLRPHSRDKQAYLRISTYHKHFHQRWNKFALSVVELEIIHRNRPATRGLPERYKHRRYFSRYREISRFTH